MSAVCGVCGATTGDDVLCVEHRASLRNLLAEIPDLLAELLDRRRRLSRPSGGGPGGGGDGHPIPWDDGAARVLADVEARVRLACHAEAGMTATEALSARLSAWKTWGDVTAWDGLREAARRAQDYLSPPARWYAGICSAEVATDDPDEPTTMCTRDLYARGTTGQVRCPSCRTVHDVAQRRAVLVDRVDDQLVTLHEFAHAAPDLLGRDVHLSRAQGWVRRGRIVRRGQRTREIVDPSTGATYLRQVAVYRFGDLRELAVTSTRRQRTCPLDKSDGLSITSE